MKEVLIVFCLLIVFRCEMVSAEGCGPRCGGTDSSSVYQQACQYYVYYYSPTPDNAVWYDWCTDYVATCSYTQALQWQPNCADTAVLNHGFGHLIEVKDPSSHILACAGGPGSEGYCLYCVFWPDVGGGGGCGDVVCPGDTQVQADCSCGCSGSCSQDKVRAGGDSCGCSCRSARVVDDLSLNSTCIDGFFSYALSFAFTYTDTNEPAALYPYSSDVQMFRGDKCVKNDEAYDCPSWESVGSGEGGIWWRDFPDGIYKWHVKIFDSCGDLLAEFDKFYNHQCQCACGDPLPGGPPVF